MPQIQRLLHGHAAVLRSKIQHARRAAEHRRARAGFEIVRRDRHAEVEIEVRVRVDKAREYEPAGRVERFVRSTGHARRDARDHAVFNQQIRLFGSFAAHDRSVSNQNTQGARLPLSDILSSSV